MESEILFENQATMAITAINAFMKAIKASDFKVFDDAESANKIFDKFVENVTSTAGATEAEALLLLLACIKLFNAAYQIQVRTAQSN
jgi:limonene-1,2-epoxide hydrolase